MKHIHTLLRSCGVVILLLLLSVSAHSQTQMPLPAHSQAYNGIYARGYWFIAPMNFTITGLMVAPEAGTGLQYIHVMKCTGTFPIAASAPGSSAFTTLAYISGAPNNVIQPVSISVQQGDQIGILGTVTGICNSYAGSAIVTSTIGTQSVYLNRFGYQGNIETGPALGYWGQGDGTSGQIGRVFMYYSLASRTDAGIDTLVSPGDTLCAGTQPVSIRLCNYGPQPMVSTTIHWSVNNQPQTPYAWTGNVPVNGKDTVTIGTFHFHSDTTYSIKAYTHNPNNFSDTANFNDTLVKSGLYVRPAPTLVLNDTTKSICQGDSVILTGTLTGSPPWSLVIKDGNINTPITQITSPTFNYTITPSTTKTYTIKQISDATGCENTAEYNFHVSVQPAPPAQITPVTTTAACLGDSVVLMASIGLNFTYQWYMNGNTMPNHTSYTLACKQAGDYSVKVISPIGCSNLSAPVTVMIHPLPVVNLGKDTVLLPSQHITLNAGAGFSAYFWSTGQTSQQIVVDTAGLGIGVKTIWVRVTDNYFCHGTDTIKINFTNNPGIETTITSQEKIFLFPNPTSGKTDLVINGFAPGAAEVEIYGQHGRLVMHQQPMIQTGETIINIDASTLAEGIYLMRIKTAEGVSTRKLVIRR